MSFILLIAASAVDPALVARADQMNLDFVQCLFATARTAREQGNSSEQFSVTLTRSCPAERDRLHLVTVEILRQQGHSKEEAEQEWSRLEVQARASVERAYAPRSRRSVPSADAG